ncbi:C2 family cysteine protease [Arthrobacter sp. ES3-54]|uniref:C2 family cysteine protease n=1 Tax=Arthrobacter sp. ES3-54 TaxID=1502991 RepID=UPI00240516FE|nr:C2 family cysteine protease [Arthrobacter sp. ES3-54]
MSAKFQTIVICSLIAVIVILGIAYLFISRSNVSPIPGASGPQGNNPTVSGRATYQKVPNQVLFAHDSAGKPNISGDLTNIKQGDAGDCYFLAALMTVAARSPETILNMVHDNGNGTYTITFHSKYDGVPNPVTVTVNGDLPFRRDKPFENGIENIDGKNVSWAAIIEKGWAAANGNSYKGIDGTDLSNAQDHDVHNGLYAITGEAGVDRNPGGPMTDVTFAQIAEDFASGLITLGTSNSDGKLVSDHSYALLGVNSSDQTVVVGDPEGGQETLSFETFQSTNINQYIAIPALP